MTKQSTHQFKKIIIAIDGYVATGKGTTAIWLAKKLWYTYLDTGAMYRAVALYAIRHGLLDAPENEKKTMLSQITLSFHYNPETHHNDMMLNGENIEKEIRQTSLSSQMKPIVVSPSVRSWLGEEQKRIGQEGGIVVDGRDMGTVVFPNAELKLFLTGNVDIRAQRRYDEMLSRGINSTKEEIYQDIELRDQTDYLWPDAVNTKAHDAIEIDTSVLTVDEQITLAYNLTMEKIHG